MAATLTLILFTVLTVAINLPQAIRLWSTRDPAGLSVTGLLNGGVGYAAWVVYLTAQAQWIPAAATAIATALWTGITWYAIARLGATRRQVGSAVGYALLLTVLAAVNLSVFGVVLSIGAVWAGLPAVLEAWRAPQISGLSAGSWLLYTAESLSWLAWACVVSDPVLVLYGVLATGIGASILAAIGLRTDARRTPATGSVGVVATG